MSDEKKTNPVWFFGNIGVLTEEWELLRDEQSRLIKSPDGYYVARRMKTTQRNTKMSERPSKCKWCNQLPQIVKRLFESHTWFYVQCDKCEIRTDHRASEERAVAEWNDQTNK